MQRKSYSLAKTTVLKSQFLRAIKQLIVNKTVVTSKTIVFSKYLENILLSNGAFVELVALLRPNIHHTGISKN